MLTDDEQHVGLVVPPAMVAELHRLELHMAEAVKEKYQILENLENTPTSGVVLNALMGRIDLMLTFGEQLYGLLPRLAGVSDEPPAQSDEPPAQSDEPSAQSVHRTGSTVTILAGGVGAGKSARRTTRRRRRAPRTRPPGRTTLRRRRDARAKAGCQVSLRRRRPKALRRRPTKRAVARRAATNPKARPGTKPRTRKRGRVPRRTVRRKPR